MNWQQYSKRRGGMSIEDFLTGCSSKQEAIARFVKRQIDPPEDLLEKFYSPHTSVVSDTDVQADSNIQQSETFVKKVKAVSSGTSTN